jgi:hypothetical protein
MRMAAVFQAAVGLLLLLLGIFVAPLWSGANPWITVFVLTGGIVSMLFAAVSLITPSGASGPDERDRKVRAFAFSYAYQFTFVVVLILFLINRAGLIQVTGEGALILLFLVMGVSGSVLQGYLGRRGDVE